MPRLRQLERGSLQSAPADYGTFKIITVTSEAAYTQLGAYSTGREGFERIGGVVGGEASRSDLTTTLPAAISLHQTHLDYPYKNRVGAKGRIEENPRTSREGGGGFWGAGSRQAIFV